MGCISYDQMDPNIDFLVFNNSIYWTELYGDVKGELTPKILETRGRAVSIYLIVDANRSSNVVMRRSHNDIIMFILNASIIWFSKTQNTFMAAHLGASMLNLGLARIWLLRWDICYGFLVSDCRALRIFSVIIVESLRTWSSLSQHFTKNTMSWTIIQFVSQLQKIFYNLGKRTKIIVFKIFNKDNGWSEALVFVSTCILFSISCECWKLGIWEVLNLCMVLMP